MKVLKFGGTSVGTVTSLTAVKAIVEAQDKPVIIVVSALGGVTDMLIATAKAAAAGDTQGYLETFARIRSRHTDVITGIVPTDRQPYVSERARQMLEELANIFKGVSLLRDLSPRSLDIIVSYGERLSSMIISNIIADATLFDSRKFIKTTDQFGKHVLEPSTNTLVEEAFSAAEFKVAVVPGFISTDIHTGDITNLGRGGSDYTAAIIAATLAADTLEIWTDVDGFMTADPRIVKDAEVIDRLDFVEAMELCNFGAKVVYPPTIYPVFHRNIPILIKNTFNPTASGTLIGEGQGLQADYHAPTVGVSSIKGVTLLALEDCRDCSSRMVNALSRCGIEALMPSADHHCCAVKSADLGKALEALADEFAAELTAGAEIKQVADLAIVAAVGRAVTPERMARSVRAIYPPEQVSAQTVACMVRMDQTDLAINAIHSDIILTDFKRHHQI